MEQPHQTGEFKEFRPVPDPTLLTTQQLTREIGALREIIETRLDGNDKAYEILHQIIHTLPSQVDEKIDALKEVHEEKFRSIQGQFTERDVRTDQTSRDSKLAVDAALQAAKEAVAKSETATVKQIDQQGELISSNTDSLNDKIDDIKQRLTILEGRGEGANENRSRHQAAGSYLIAAVGLVLTFISVGSAIYVATKSTPAPQQVSAPAPPQILYVPAPAGLVPQK